MASTSPVQPSPSQRPPSPQPSQIRNALSGLLGLSRSDSFSKRARVKPCNAAASPSAGQQAASPRAGKTRPSSHPPLVSPAKEVDGQAAHSEGRHAAATGTIAGAAVPGAAALDAVVVCCAMRGDILALEEEGAARHQAAVEESRSLQLQLQVAQYEIKLLQEHLHSATSRGDELAMRLEDKEGELQRANAQLLMHMRQSGSLLAELVQRTEGQMATAAASSAGAAAAQSPHITPPGPSRGPSKVAALAPPAATMFGPPTAVAAPAAASSATTVAAAAAAGVAPYDTPRHPTPPHLLPFFGSTTPRMPSR